MSDARLRTLQRRWEESGLVEDEVAYRIERVRSGHESLDYVVALGCTGDPTAQLVADQVAPDWRGQRAAIRPGVGIGPFRIGIQVEALPVDASALPLEKREGVDVLRAPLIDFFVETRTGRVNQILAKPEFPGAFLEEVRVGSQLSTLYRVVGVVYEDEEDVLLSDRFPGIGFEADGMSGDASLVAIFVFCPSRM